MIILLQGREVLRSFYINGGVEGMEWSVLPTVWKFSIHASSNRISIHDIFLIELMYVIYFKILVRTFNRSSRFKILNLFSNVGRFGKRFNVLIRLPERPVGSGGKVIKLILCPLLRSSSTFILRAVTARGVKVNRLLLSELAVTS